MAVVEAPGRPALRIVLVALPVLSLASLFVVLVWSTSPSPMRFGTNWVAEDLLFLVWSTTPALALLVLSLLIIRRPGPWRGLLIVQAAFLLLTILVLVDTYGPEASSTAALGLLFLPIPQWVIVIVGVLALLLATARPRRPSKQHRFKPSSKWSSW